MATDHFNLTLDPMFHGEHLREIYERICSYTVHCGSLTSPRGMRTREILFPTIVIENPSDCLPLGVGRKPSAKIAAVEAVQLCGAFSDPDLMVAASREFEKYQEPEGYFHGAYGNRIGRQLYSVVDKLKRDPDSRQAVITLWDQRRDNLEGKRDYPCTVSFQFLIRNNRLVMSTNMRSNDVWLGLAYDLFQFGQLQWTAANMLGVEAGPLIHRPVSLHAYERNWEQIDGLHDLNEYGIDLYGFPDVYSAFLIGNGGLGLQNLEQSRNLTYTETWFVDTLAPLRRDAAGTPS